MGPSNLSDSDTPTADDNLRNNRKKVAASGGCDGQYRFVYRRLAEKHAPGAPGRSDVQAIIKNQFDVFWQGDGGVRWLGFVLDSSCLWHDHGVNEENDIWPVLWALWTF